jgi:hypothetical protein
LALGLVCRWDSAMESARRSGRSTRGLACRKLTGARGLARSGVSPPPPRLG